jgi:hypothetical protein
MSQHSAKTETADIERRVRQQITLGELSYHPMVALDRHYPTVWSVVN